MSGIGLKPTKEALKKQSLEFGKSLVFVIGAVLLIRAFLFESFHIPTGSMIPSLLVGDYLVVSKFDYGYSRFSLPFGYYLPFKGRIFDFFMPKRNDVVVFRLPHKPSTDFVKRVIGLPGDKIQLREGILYINEKAVHLKEIGRYKKVADEKGKILEGDLFEETLPEGHVHPFVKKIPMGRNPADNTPVYIVPPRHYFVIGDNRDGSLDSRMHGLGYIHRDYIVGRARLIFFSTDTTARWYEPHKWWSAWRGPSRMGQLIR